jgi:hypothetical protein
MSDNPQEEAAGPSNLHNADVNAEQEPQGVQPGLHPQAPPQPDAMPLAAPPGQPGIIPAQPGFIPLQQPPPANVDGRVSTFMPPNLFRIGRSFIFGSTPPSNKRKRRASPSLPTHQTSPVVINPLSTPRINPTSLFSLSENNQGIFTPIRGTPTPIQRFYTPLTTLASSTNNTTVVTVHSSPVSSTLPKR